MDHLFIYLFLSMLYIILLKHKKMKIIGKNFNLSKFYLYLDNSFIIFCVFEV